MSQSRLAIIPSRAVADASLTATQLRVLCAIGSYTGKEQSAYPKQSTIAELLGISRETVNRAIKVLKKAGYVEVEAQFKNAGGGQSASLYYVRLDPCDDTITGGVTCDSSVTGGVIPTVTGGVTPAITPRTIQLNDTSSDEEVVTPKPVDQISLAYDSFKATAERLKAQSGAVVWPIPRKLSPKRRGALKARIDEYGSDAWGEVLRNAANSDFLCGRSTNWAADFDFLISPSGFLKTLEGKYDNRTSPNTATSQRFAGPSNGASGQSSNPALRVLSRIQEASRGGDHDSGVLFDGEGDVIEHERVAPARFG
jgi:DNA-binding transcriptional ArsR family regulator